MKEDIRPRRQLLQDPERVADVELKHERIRQLLTATRADAALLQDPANIAWFTAGADVSRFSVAPCQTSLFITADARLFATNSVDSAMIFEREAYGLGFQLKQREWYQPHAALVEDLARGRRVISDSGFDGTKSASQKFADLRLPLTSLEVNRLRTLSRVLVHAVETTARNVTAGMTEAAIAGEISHRLLRRTITPVRIQVASDGRNERYRHWGFGEDAVDSFAVLGCTARRWGLHVAVTRTVVLGSCPAALLSSFQKALMILGTGIFFTRHGQQFHDIWPKVSRIYEKFGVADEWQLADQADVIGYRSSEFQLTPESQFQFQAPTAVWWHPSVGAASVGETVLVTENGVELLTRSDTWPDITVQVKRQELRCPGLLRLNRESEKTAADVPGSDMPINVDSVPADEGDLVPTRMESAWELELAHGPSVFEEDDGPYSPDSVLG